MKSSIITAEQHVIASDHRPVKGRGALSNLQGRFEHQLREAFDDGWDDGWDEGRNDGRDRPEDEMPALQTQSPRKSHAAS